ncbi:DDE superfamily endonuclease domain-containing protein [Phthorimaea operculella]|nr:DDE superfamily endonuclease domain-containing protein [Phthorimaea operculella]
MEKNKRKQYTEEALTAALEEIRNGMTVYKASQQFDIPETTLRNKRDGLHSDKCGVPAVFSKHEENRIVDWIHYLGRSGFPITKVQLIETVAKLTEELKRTNRFKDGVPGKKWIHGFLKRNPTVSLRISKNLPTSRNQVTEEALKSWFQRVYEYLQSKNMLDVLEDPQRIFNCDETGFFLCPKEKKVLVRKGSKRVYNRVDNDEKECLTVLVNVSANGDIAPPMVLFPYKRMPKYLKFSVPGSWGLGHSESGWMNMEAFYEYITNVYYPWLVKKEIPLPVILFLDGHTSHISLPLTTFCNEKGIILVALLPNSTHVLQPLNDAVFRPVKDTWRATVREFMVKNNYTKLKRTDFAPEVQKCFDRCLKPETIKSGFECCGLYPFDPNNINYVKLLSKVKKRQEKLSSSGANDALQEMA